MKRRSTRDSSIETRQKINVKQVFEILLLIFNPRLLFTSQCGLHNRTDYELSNHDPDHHHHKITPVFKRRREIIKK